MSLNTPSDSFSSRARFSIDPKRISEILCHRSKQGREEFLVRWVSETAGQPVRVSPKAVCSWHGLHELTRCLHLVQKYLERTTTRSEALKKTVAPNQASTAVSRKRKLNEDVLVSRDPRFGIITPDPTSRSSSVHSAQSKASTPTSIKDSKHSKDTDIYVYNGILERKEGWIVAKKGGRVKGDATTDATMLPTPEMTEEAATTSITQAERAIRDAFHRKVKRVPKLGLENQIDSSTPSLDFTFVNEYVFREGVIRADEEILEGCDKPCRPNMGGHCGCEYPKHCKCLEFAAVNEPQLKAEDAERYQEYMQLKEEGAVIDMENLPKRFPYHKSKDERFPQTLVRFYLEERYPIYECNPNCNCGPVCKSRVVQKGRKVPLTIFKTKNRGWGVTCDEDLIPGEFIDTYLGEVITNEEADRREKAGTKDKASYLYSLDKFVGDRPELTAESCYVVDGQYMGGATRFINHSCEPNCRQYTVSYNKYDLRVYDLAFFAIEPIPAGTELTFDYMDKDEEEEEDVIRKREAAAKDPSNKDKKPCNCGAKKCRGYLWT